MGGSGENNGTWGSPQGGGSKRAALYFYLVFKTKFIGR
jgi:hypothetical protein